MTIDNLKTIFKVKYADKGSLYRPVQEQTYINYIDFLDECEGTMYVHANAIVIIFTVIS